MLEDTVMCLNNIANWVKETLRPMYTGIITVLGAGWVTIDSKT